MMKKMKRITLSAAWIILSAIAAVSQNNGIPRSFTEAYAVPAPVAAVMPPDVSRLLQEDITRDRQGVLYRTGTLQPLAQHVTTASGRWTGHADGSVTWLMTFKGAQAKALGIYFETFSIPEQGKLFVYNTARTHVVGPYTSENSVAGDLFAAAPVTGDEITLEYNGPSESADAFNLEIAEVAYMYRDGGFAPRDAGDFGTSESCEVNANCSEGAAWGPQRRSVVKIVVRDGSEVGLCSGALVNTANEECTPYVLTANHCGGGATTANFKQWIFYFNFETPGCTNPASATDLDDQTVTGCLKMANSADVSDVMSSDFLLVHLKTRPATSFNAHMAGWSRSTAASPSGVGIHHPAGDVKKISTYTSTLTTSGWSGSNTGKHWGVRWAATANGHGVTEGGSSGSPLFDQNGRIVGDLSGGSSDCSNQNGEDVYGKFLYSWDQTGTTANRRLKDWLDKTGLNPASQNGKDVAGCASAALPSVDFVADNTTPSTGQTVNFTDQSTGAAGGYVWLITPATHTYVGGTDATSQNPKVQFSTTSAYTVMLHVYNTAGYEIKSRVAYIKPHATASVEESAPFTARLFPNPSEGGTFWVTSATGQPIERVTVTDLNGKTGYTWQGDGSGVPVHHPALAPGIYFVKIEGAQQAAVEKLVVY